MNELWYACAKPFGVYKQGLHAEGHMTSHRGTFRDKGFPKGCLSSLYIDAMHDMSCNDDISSGLFFICRGLKSVMD